MSKSHRKKTVRAVAKPAFGPVHTPVSRTSRAVKHTSTRAYWALGAVGIVGLLVASFWTDGNRPGGAPANTSLAVGSRAPSFTGFDPLIGGDINSTSLVDKNVLYYFSAGSTCQACMTQAQALQRDAQLLKQDHITLVMITNDNATALASSARANGLTIPMIADPNGLLTRRFGAVGGGMNMGTNTADHSFVLVDRRGVVRFHEDYPSMWISPSSLIHLFPSLT